MNKNIRFVSVLGLAAVAAASQAVNFNFVGTTSPVTLSASGAGTFTSTGSTIGGTPSPFSQLTFANVVLTGGANSTATFFISPSNTTDTFRITFDGTTDNSQAGLQSLSSSVSSFFGTGIFSSYTQGALNVTSNTNLSSPTSNGFVVTGIVTPEPASFAALGVGALALIRRRRKA